MAELMGDKTDINRFCFWVEFALKFPNKQRIATAEICRILDSRHLNTETLKVSLEFFNNLYPSAFIPLWREVFARGSVNEEQTTESHISPFLCKLLFETVTSTLVGCAEYCADVWLERLEDNKQKPTECINKEFPNPMDFLKTGTLTESHVSFAIFTALSLQSSMQRKTFIWECCRLLKCTPSQFHVRIILGLFVLLEFYKSQSRPDTESCTDELEVWTDTWLHLVASSLLGKFRVPQNTPEMPLSKYNTSRPSIHHMLCSLMISTQSFGVLKSSMSVRKKVVKGMEQLVLFSSGITTTWLNVIKSYFEDSEVGWEMREVMQH